MMYSPPIDPLKEIGAYEALWDEPKSSFKNISECFKDEKGVLPSDLIKNDQVAVCSKWVREKFEKAGFKGDFGAKFSGMPEYPDKLYDAKYPVRLLYYQGQWDLLNARCISIVGSRKPSAQGKKQTQELVRNLLKDNFVIMSGLAEGIDTVAHETALSEGGRTIAVLGTPLTESYPKSNSKLQKYIAEKYLVVSQIPMRKYEKQDYRLNRFFFTERNKTMSALSLATVIVEAGEKSGTHVQARAALEQNRKLFILDSCFKNYEWPEKFEKKGAIRVVDYSDIQRSIL